MTEGQQTISNKRIRAASIPPRVSLPEDLVNHVLLLLPARTLARFRCVCRSWNAHITSRGFQESHHALASSVALPLKFAFLPMAARGPCIKHFPGCRGCPRLVGTKPCRGVVLVERRCGGKFSVCNLSTGGVLHLPLPPRANFIDDVFHSAGIGFDASTGEYKVVNLRVNCTDKARCNVLTLSDDSTGDWRPLAAAAAADQFLPDCHVFVDKDVDPVFADGSLHWMFKTDGTRYDEPHGILSFSLADESFRRAPQPFFSTADLALLDYESADPQRSRVGFTSSGDSVIMPAGRALTELNGSLCIVRDVRRRNDVEGLFEIWKLQDYEAGSWSMDFIISLAGDIAEQLTKPWLVLPICYLGGSRRKIVLVTSARKVHVYDADTNDVHTVAASLTDDMVRKAEEPSEFVRFLLYQKSLVQLDGMEYDDREIQFVQMM
uniref:Uncharacterized protein n=1 Tax=Avena sativa TaxID=4498 RepID=A0ACD5ZX81_AVESA